MYLKLFFVLYNWIIVQEKDDTAADEDHVCKCYSFTLPKKYLVWVFACYKTWEGRLYSSVLRNGVPCVGCEVCLFAGSAGVLWCKVRDVKFVRDPRDLIDRSNWRLFVPWESSFTRAVSLYDNMNDGCGFFFFHLWPPYRFSNIGGR